MNIRGYRGYIGSRLSNERSVPQHIQQQVIRDYCQRNGMKFLLSATEYAMEGSTMMLDAALDDLPNLDGIVMYSLGLMPKNRNKRITCLAVTIGRLHFAAENIAIRSVNDFLQIDETFKLMDLYERNELSPVLTRLHAA